jgi:uncharacterized protein
LTADYSDEVREHRSALVRGAYVAAGALFVVLGILGIFLPVLPATPFMLLAAACFARASKRFYNLLMNNRLFGPAIREWQVHRSIARRTKLWAIGLMAATLTTSIVFFVKEPSLQVALAVLGVALAAWLYRVPSRR